MCTAKTGGASFPLQKLRLAVFLRNIRLSVLKRMIVTGRQCS